MSTLPPPGVHELLTALIVTAITSGLAPSAQFLAERLYTVNASDETTTYLLALAYWRAGQPRAAIEILRQRVIPPMNMQIALQQINGLPKMNVGRYGPVTAVPRPANECSIRCAWIYASCCGEVGRPKEGEEVLAKVVQLLGVTGALLFPIPHEINLRYMVQTPSSPSLLRPHLPLSTLTWPNWRSNRVSPKRPLTTTERRSVIRGGAGRLLRVSVI